MHGLGRVAGGRRVKAPPYRTGMFIMGFFFLLVLNHSVWTVGGSFAPDTQVGVSVAATELSTERMQFGTRTRL
jgi:hypothetical protein